MTRVERLLFSRSPCLKKFDKLGGLFLDSQCQSREFALVPGHDCAGVALLNSTQAENISAAVVDKPEQVRVSACLEQERRDVEILFQLRRSYLFEFSARKSRIDLKAKRAGSLSHCVHEGFSAPALSRALSQCLTYPVRITRTSRSD